MSIDRRGEMTPDQMTALKPGHGWDDGREGFLFCRIEAVLDDERMIRAEVTWNDDSEEREDGEVTTYFNPMITLESNRPDPTNPDTWRTLDAKHIDISGDLAREIVESPSANVMREFRHEIDSLRIYEGVRRDAS